jgi:hypothetical protein
MAKRKEDKAYSLLGIFDLYMPLIYGEGRENTFIRLEKEISEYLKGRVYKFYKDSTHWEL